jgi:leucyl-tRNA synthetase
MQVNGKLRDSISVDTKTAQDKALLEKTVRENEKVLRFTAGKEIIKIIVIPGKLVNVVVR